MVLGFTLYCYAEASYNPTYQKDLLVNQPSYSDSQIGKPQLQVDGSMSGCVDGGSVADASENGWKTIQRLVDRLEGANLIRRETCQNDRRGAFAVLTNEAVNAAENVDSVRSKHRSVLWLAFE